MNIEDLKRLRETPPAPNAFTAGLAAAGAARAQAHVSKIRNISILVGGVLVAALVVGLSLLANSSEHAEDPPLQPSITVTTPRAPGADPQPGAPSPTDTAPTQSATPPTQSAAPPSLESGPPVVNQPGAAPTSTPPVVWAVG